MRRTAQIAVVTASLLGGGIAGGLILTPALSGAQEDPGTTDPTTDDTTATTTSPDTTDEDVTTDERPAFDGWIDEALAPLVEDGTITQEQADAVTDALESARPERPDGPGWHGGGRGWFGDLSVVAEALGIEEDALRDALADGQTLAEIATANGVDVQAVIDAIITEAQAHLDEALADGRIDADELAELQAELTERITDLVNGELEGRFPSGFGGFGPGGPGGPGGPDHPFGDHDDTPDDSTDDAPDDTADDPTTTTS
jgi:hypothetical protein